MRPQTLAVVMLALACGLAAALGVRSTWKRPQVVEEEKVPVVVAKAELPRGQAIEAGMVEVRQVPKSQAPEGVLAKAEEAAERTPSIPMLAGEFVVGPKLLPKGSRSGMAAMIQPGMRAFTILTPSFSSSLAGFLQPGNRVDVLLTITPPGAQGDDGSTTSTILQNVELLAVHNRVDAPAGAKVDPNDSRSVTLMVTPKQASILDLAQNKGTLHLSLRSSLDETPAEGTTATLADLGLAPPPAPTPTPAPAPPPEPVAAAPAPEPEPPPVVLRIRTLRGTLAGHDEITILRAGARPTTEPLAGGSTVASPGPRRPAR